MTKIVDQEAGKPVLERAISLANQEWPTGTKPLVSISCTVYNQEKYVERCLQGFLSQETTFPVEILIHDDASTDGTTEILKKYLHRYPFLIRLTCQVENQFSKGKLVNEFNFKKAKGDYIALCHGDDYWIDKGKLEKQVAVMRNLGVSISGHPAKEIDAEGNDLNRLTGFQVNSVAKLDSKKLIRRNGNLLPFGSIIITRAAKEDILVNMPPVMFHTGIQMLGAFRGGIAVMPDVMSVYRTSVPGSTTEIMLGDYAKKLKTTHIRVFSIKHLKEMYGDDYYGVFDGLLARQVTPFISEVKIRESCQILSDVLKGEPLKSKCRILARTIFRGTGLIVLKGIKLMNSFIKLTPVLVSRK